MDHPEASVLLTAYLDNELGISEALAVERHLENCLACRRELAQHSALREQLRECSLRLTAPAHLVARVESALPSATPPLVATRRFSFDMFSAKAGLVMAALLASLWGAYLFSSTSMDRAYVADQVIGSHVRSMQLGHLYDVASTDQHTVKPWFNGKLDFSPPVTDLDQQGFPLMGGRLDYLNERSVAALVYRRERHPINLFVWPDTGADQAPRHENRAGFHVVHWRRAGMQFWAVSDVAENDLERFTEAYRAALRGR